MDRTLLITGFLALLFLYILKAADFAGKAGFKTPTNSIATQSTSILPICPPSLARGSTESGRIKQLQILLQNQYLLSNINTYTGIFESQTEQAVKYLQQQHNLDVTGIVDANTWMKLINCQPQTQLLAQSNTTCPDTLKIGDHAMTVKILQIQLQSRGFLIGRHAIDGFFGSYTEAAVIAFQRSQGIRSDGIVGQLTWSLLGFCQYNASNAHSMG